MSERRGGIGPSMKRVQSKLESRIKQQAKTSTKADKAEIERLMELAMKQANELFAAKARIAEAEKVIAPLAELCSTRGGSELIYEDNEMFFGMVEDLTFGEVRAARAWMEAKP